VYAECAKRGKEILQTVEFFQVDERYVPQGDVNSNFNLIIQSGLPPLARAFHHFDTSISIAESLRKYEIELPEYFDLVVLGIGEDGHIASLFPHDPALHEKIRLVAHTTTDVFAVKDRLTITLPLILSSKKILVLLKGAEKKKVLDEILYVGRRELQQNSEHSEREGEAPVRLCRPEGATRAPIKALPAKALLGHNDVTVHFLM